MNNFPAMHFPVGARGNNFDSQIKRIPFASNGVFCACIARHAQLLLIRSRARISFLFVN